MGDTNIPVTSVKDEDFNHPRDYALLQNFPNFFNPKTIISWQSSVFSHTTIKIFDILGKEIATLIKEEKPAGEYKVEFDGSNLSSGVYFYKLTATDLLGNKQTQTKQMLLLK